MLAHARLFRVAERKGFDMPLVIGRHRARCLVRTCAAAAAALVTVLSLATTTAAARDRGQWGDRESPTRQWFESLRMPEQPSASCCGAADGYWADEFEAKDGHYIAIVTDTRPDGPLARTHIPPGTRFVVPHSKITRTPDNPTGHGWIFVVSGIVFCYLPPTGI